MITIRMPSFPTPPHRQPSAISLSPTPDPHHQLLRKNYLFAGNKAGGKAAAVFYSLIESAKCHDVNVADYLEDVIRRLASHPRHRLHELLPDQWKPQAASGI